MTTSDPRPDSLRRRARSVGGRVVQRLGLLPAGVPDARGNDRELVAAGPLAEHVVVYFGSTRESVYQLAQWLPVLEQLHARHPVVVVTADSRAAADVRALTGLRVVTVSRYATFDEMVTGGAARLALYVNHHVQNFSLLRFADLTHVSLLHGDSDKVVSVSNQAKAYDFMFVAGRAAVDRLASGLRRFDAERRCVVVGRPQAAPLPRERGEQLTVLYAPTWEGAQTSAAYSSLVTHGAAIARSLVGDPDVRFVYRPHPLTGVRNPTYGEADVAVRRIVAEAGTRGRVSGAGSLEADFAEADVLVCDVSAVAVDWLATSRPLVLTDPSGSGVDRGLLVREVRSLAAERAIDAAVIARDEVERDPYAAERKAMAEYYLGDTTPGASLRRFLDACERILAGQEPVVAAAEPRQAEARD
ncbi:CDP-glycerol glycerophosphotransferase family protein [Cellulomonas sp. HZM]|uniref:CDP-glycerol glycerophosphotransferase family protein n=1 Tax=Cellulomonas sp. HZM TaxID=1454010 RepID=UPI00049351C2|nr:CDP-glycerol glycerophosphotransferase family protein [Cellulomonas sp. HZM]